jgi:DNA polymerase-3 subunit beta
MIDKTIFSVSSDETRHALNGVFWSAKKGVFEMVSTDGRRLSVVAKKIVPADKEFQVIVPTKVLTEMERTINNQGSKEGDGENVLLTVNENQIGFQMKSTTIMSRLLAGSFPNYQQVIPQKKDIMVTVGTEELLAVTKRAALAVGDRGGVVKYTLRRGALAVDAQSPNVECKDEISLEYDGPEFQTAFNPGFVVDALKHINTEKTQLSMTNPVNPVLFEPAGGDDYRFVVMPMRG